MSRPRRKSKPDAMTQAPASSSMLQPAAILAWMGEGRATALRRRHGEGLDAWLHDVCGRFQGSHEGNPDADVASAALEALHRSGEHCTAADVRRWELTVKAA